ncbi:hypothetical protein COO91_05482 [Nostoc flagelliforme CCNUN1]|uniref:Uncharacterized protein n=1 Tax=Nostoc flagelliforme CCNUN1 TaxID=2038116 RepID=A0A2K8SVM4_9NOSO|nr:hypothetical protein COO91_05482 [Nostoc flagelliforme CCNUN1]
MKLLYANRICCRLRETNRVLDFIQSPISEIILTSSDNYKGEISKEDWEFLIFNFFPN